MMPGHSKPGPEPLAATVKCFGNQAVGCMVKIIKLVIAMIDAELCCRHCALKQNDHETQLHRVAAASAADSVDISVRPDA